MSSKPEQSSWRAATGARTTRRSRNSRPSRIPHKSYVTRRELNGGKLDLPSNPPEVTHQPWMPLTVVHSGMSGDISMTVRDIVLQAVRQLDPTGHAFKPHSENWSASECVLQIRIRSIRVWNVTGRMIALSVDDFSDANKAISDVDTLCGLVDTGSAAHVPSVGYDLPSTHKHIVLRNDSLTSKAIVYHVNCPSNDVCIIYTNIFLRCDGPAKVSSFNDSMSKMVSRIRGEVVDMNKSVSDIKKATDKLVEHDRGTIGKAISKGAEIIAPYVITAAAADENERMDRIEALLQRLVDVNLNKPDVSISSFEEADEELVGSYPPL